MYHMLHLEFAMLYITPIPKKPHIARMGITVIREKRRHPEIQIKVSTIYRILLPVWFLFSSHFHYLQ